MGNINNSSSMDWTQAALAGIQAIGNVGTVIAGGQRRSKMRYQNELNKQMADHQFDLQRQMIAEQNEYNSPLEQMKRFGAAGLNPNLIYSQGTPGNQTEIAKYQAPEQKAVSNTAWSDVLSGVSKSFQDGLNALLTKMQIKKLEKETEGQDLENQYKAGSLGDRIAQQGLQLALMTGNRDMLHKSLAWYDTQQSQQYDLNYWNAKNLEEKWRAQLFGNSITKQTYNDIVQGSHLNYQNNLRRFNLDSFFDPLERRSKLTLNAANTKRALSQAYLNGVQGQDIMATRQSRLNLMNNQADVAYYNAGNGALNFLRNYSLYNDVDATGVPFYLKKFRSEAGRAHYQEEITRKDNQTYRQDKWISRVSKLFDTATGLIPGIGQMYMLKNGLGKFAIPKDKPLLHSKTRYDYDGDRTYQDIYEYQMPYDSFYE